MRGRNVMAVSVVGMLVAGGCAGARSAQEIERLKADVGLLDQRVNQLERGSLKEPAQQSEWSAEESQPSAAVVVPASPTQKPAGAASAKPSKKEIQRALKNAGFYQGTVDGRIGAQTREAIRTFQQVHGLKADGVVGKQTWEKLAPYLEAAAAPAAAGDAGTGAAEPAMK